MSPADAREFLTVVGVAAAGLVLGAVVAFAPWYAGPAGDADVMEVRGPVAPVAPAQQR
jgi:hypothetical protein